MIIKKNSQDAFWRFEEAFVYIFLTQSTYHAFRHFGVVKWGVNLFKTSHQKGDFHIFYWIKMTSIFSMLKLVLNLLNADVLEVWSTITQTS